MSRSREAGQRLGRRVVFGEEKNVANSLYLVSGMGEVLLGLIYGEGRNVDDPDQRM